MKIVNTYVDQRLAPGLICCTCHNLSAFVRKKNMQKLLMFKEKKGNNKFLVWCAV